MKKRIAAALAAMIFLMSLGGTALADSTSRIVFGKDLTQAQKQQMLDYFGVKDGDVKTLTLTHDEETALLGSVFPKDKLGTHSLSSIYIKETAEGSGLNVETKNISWVTPEMYMAVLMTAGIVDADIKIAAPISVSGTAALAGVFKAYEDITGTTLNIDAKQIAADELAYTGQLADAIGAADATQIVNALKAAQDQVKGKSDDEIRAFIKKTAGDYNVTLNDAQITQMLKLVKRLGQLNIDPEKVAAYTQQIKDLTNKLKGMQQSAQGFGGWFENLWDGISKFLKNIFG